MEHFTTSYERTDDGGLIFTAATLDGRVFQMQLDAVQALDNLRSFAKVLGLNVCVPLP